MILKSPTVWLTLLCSTELNQRNHQIKSPLQFSDRTGDTLRPARFNSRATQQVTRIALPRSLWDHSRIVIGGWFHDAFQPLMTTVSPVCYLAT